MPAASSTVHDAPWLLEKQPKRRPVVAPGQRRMPLVMLLHHGSPGFSPATTTGRHNESSSVLVGIKLVQCKIYFTMQQFGETENLRNHGNREIPMTGPAHTDDDPDHGGKPQGPLRQGWTTGTCASAAASAAYQALLTGDFPDPVTVALPRARTATVSLHRCVLNADTAIASVIKDAGDDPDVTHGAEVVAHVELAPPGSGVRYRGGDGVGRVTMPGLPLSVGEPAINPGPRAIIDRAFNDIARRFAGTGDAVVTISVPGGAALAKKTLNARLGIVGGISILGTTGIVVPFSCSAWIHSIHRGIDVARASGLEHIAAATGSTSEAAAKRHYGLPDSALIDMGDFAGGTLKYLKRHPVPRLTIAGGFGKLAKLAQGNLFLHSSKSRVDLSDLVAELASLGAPAGAISDAGTAETAAQVLAIAIKHACPLADRVAQRARAVSIAQLSSDTSVDVLVFDRAGNFIGGDGCAS